MKKYIYISIILSLSFIKAYSQNSLKPIQTVTQIFNHYVDLSDGTDSETNKEDVKNALISLQEPGNKAVLSLLIDVWMYYDPTDFPTRSLIEPIFIQNKQDALNAIETRLRNKRKTEKTNVAPYSDLIELKQTLSK